ncbi:response regulator [Pollutimonas bauzanensis]|uniref:Two-component system, OmpR family, phosphate regulon response regulator OmpR n=1 Tax=Pollutimonas bauzanensis TaxID=658167 RepID=A0A1M5ZG90_9BURK|nr:response regulator [Pollutimonas bauzanensis]SHI23151.1 two-component system, OmpR family, phosphate regulon response regulator OmpR [Pollutimonas bauzanensis]
MKTSMAIMAIPDPYSRLKRKILVVDDDWRSCLLLRRYLSEHGFRVCAAHGASDMARLWQRERFDLLVLGRMLPDGDGSAICHALRGARDDTAIIMLAAKADENDRIECLGMGADDYLFKPFNPRELLARLNAVLRRCSAAPHPSAPGRDDERVEFGPYVLDLSARSLTRNKQRVPITTGQFSMLKVFARHCGIPLSRNKLMEMAHGRKRETLGRSLDVRIARLRKLIEADPSRPMFIQTVRGLGYVFVPGGGPGARVNFT